MGSGGGSEDLRGRQAGTAGSGQGRLFSFVLSPPHPTPLRSLTSSRLGLGPPGGWEPPAKTKGATCDFSSQEGGERGPHWDGGGRAGSLGAGREHPAQRLTAAQEAFPPGRNREGPRLCRRNPRGSWESGRPGGTTGKPSRCDHGSRRPSHLTSPGLTPGKHGVVVLLAW